MKILLLSEDNKFIKNIKYSFKGRSRYIHLTNYNNIKEHINTSQFDLLILDISSKGHDGISLIKSIRRYSDIPIIIISNQDNDFIKISALKSGADDYMVRPINVLELEARIYAILRRIKDIIRVENYIYKKDVFTIDILKKEVVVDSKYNLGFTAKEFDLFHLLLKNPGQVFTREELMDIVWEYQDYGLSRTVDVHIRKIRTKIREFTNDIYIMTKWGEGYYYEA